MSKPMLTIELSETLTLSVYLETSGHAGFWLYDETRKMNLAMRAESREAALLSALDYYQEALARREAVIKELDTHVHAFLSGLRSVDEDRYGLNDYG